MIRCGFCTHPGAHAGFVPATEGRPAHCTDCGLCQKAERERQERR